MILQVGKGNPTTNLIAFARRPRSQSTTHYHIQPNHNTTTGTNHQHVGKAVAFNISRKENSFESTIHRQKRRSIKYPPPPRKVQPNPALATPSQGKRTIHNTMLFANDPCKRQIEIKETQTTIYFSSRFHARFVLKEVLPFSLAIITVCTNQFFARS